MPNFNIVPIILCGGSGTRLWPVSRKERPKQFLSLTSEETMLQMTALCASYISGAVPTKVIAGTAHADLIESQLAEVAITDACLLLEPCARNTAPAIALAALTVEDPNDVLVVMPSDHVIANRQAFYSAIEAALPLVVDGWLITFGINPDAPETGYGYIRLGATLEGVVCKVDRFVEKPDRENATAMLRQGGHVWNGGIFMFRAAAYLDELKRYRPDIFAAAEAAVTNGKTAGRRFVADASDYELCPSDSIDYAVMERADRVACVPVSMGWSDVGSWDSLHGISKKDGAGNAARGMMLPVGAKNCFVHTEGQRVTLVDVEDLMVIVDKEDILVVRRGESQKVRKAVEAVNQLEARRAV